LYPLVTKETCKKIEMQCERLNVITFYRDELIDKYIIYIYIDLETLFVVKKNLIIVPSVSGDVF